MNFATLTNKSITKPIKKLYPIWYQIEIPDSIVLFNKTANTAPTIPDSTIKKSSLSFLLIFLEFAIIKPICNKLKYLSKTEKFKV